MNIDDEVTIRVGDLVTICHVLEHTFPVVSAILRPKWKLGKDGELGNAKKYILDNYDQFFHTWKLAIKKLKEIDAQCVAEMQREQP